MKKTRHFSRNLIIDLESLDLRRGIPYFFEFFYCQEILKFLACRAMGVKSAPLPWIRGPDRLNNRSYLTYHPDAKTPASAAFFAK